VDRFTTRAFVRLSLATGIVAGFGIGGGAFAAAALGTPVGAVWTALAQAHAHAQLFGFAGLMVLGVALIFLPRLRGAPLRGARLVPWVLALYAGGVLLRVVCQGAAPFLALAGWDAVALAAGYGNAAGGTLALAGAGLAVGMLAATGASGPPLAQRAGLRQVLPLVVAAWIGLLLALLVNAWGAWETVASWRPAAGRVPVVGEAPWLLPPALDALAVRLAFLAWLVPMSVAFAARNFPLLLWTRPAPGRWLAWGLAALVGGLLLDAGATLFGVPAQPGMALEGFALLWLTAVVGALGPKVDPPGRHRDPVERQLADVTKAPLTESFVWLAVAGALLTAQAVLPELGVAPPPEDVVRHSLGAGFVLLLIVGMAPRLIPGFAGAAGRADVRAVRVAYWAAQAAALLRVAPPLAVWLVSSAGMETLPLRLIPPLLALAGAAGMVSLAALWWALRAALSR
jgi:uncharacterized protein involved in response to NO